MAGIPLTQQRRSQLLEALLAQQGQEQPNPRSGGELAVRLAAQLVRQQQINKLNKQEQGSQEALIKALGAGQATSGQAVTLENFEGGSGAQQQFIPGKMADPGASNAAISQLPIEQQVQAAQILAMRKDLAEPTKSEADAVAFERQRTLQAERIQSSEKVAADALNARDKDLTRNLEATELAQVRSIQAQFELQTRAINAKRDELAAQPNKFSQGQWIAAGYGARAEDAGVVIDKIGKKFTGVLSRGVGLVPEGLKTADRQRFDQAKRNFINAQLRRESGAVISEQEFENADEQYFPQPGNKEDVLKQKAQNRQVVIRALQLEAGGAYSQVRAAVPLQGGAPTDDANVVDFSELPE